MHDQIIPCLWFDGNSSEAAAFYSSIFNNSELLQADDLISQFTLNRREFTALNGGPQFKINEAVSFTVYCGSDSEIERLFSVLQDGGTVLMPLKSYPWCRKYAWVKDRFGVSWQLDVDPINNPQNIVPSIMFVNEFKEKVHEAIEYYHSIFPNCTQLFQSEYDETFGFPQGTLQFAQHKINGNIFNFMSSHEKQDWHLNEAISFVLKCDDQKEIDYFWEALSLEGVEGQCGWVKDKYHISWQIIPKNLSHLLAKEGAMTRMLKMKKIVVADLI